MIRLGVINIKKMWTKNHIHCMYLLLFGMCCDVAVLLCRAIPQVQPVLQSLRRPCSHLPRPDAVCSAFSTSRAERGPTPQHYCRDSHTHTQRGASFHSAHMLSSRAVGHRTTDSLCSVQPSLIVFSSFPTTIFTDEWHTLCYIS